MVEQKPLLIRYAAGQRGVFFGWSVRGLDQINPYMVPLFTAESHDHILKGGGRLVDVVHTEVLTFFNGPLSVDLNIPPRYPYEFYEPEKNIPTYTGRLRLSHEGE